MEDKKGPSIFETFAILALLYVTYTFIKEWACKKFNISSKTFKRIMFGIFGIIYLILNFVKK
jgi:hypothetical protein